MEHNIPDESNHFDLEGIAFSARSTETKARIATLPLLSIRSKEKSKSKIEI